jgi:hypothetical protein
MSPKKQVKKKASKTKRRKYDSEYDHEGTRGLAPLPILGQAPGMSRKKQVKKKVSNTKRRKYDSAWKRS